MCIYCGQEKMEVLSDEHILPRAIGGNLLDNNLKIKVCQHCNNTLGMFVDGPFVKNWWITNHKAFIEFRRLDPERNPLVPLHYMGVWPEFKHSSKECEVWLGPAGDTILHFHEPYPELKNVPTMVGVPSYCRGRQYPYDTGFVLIYLRSNNPVWMRATLISVEDHFTDSALYVGNLSPVPSGGRFEPIPEDLAELCASVAQRLQERREFKLSVAANIKCGDRFLSKLALGIGAKLLSNEFLTSESAARLRQFMWEGNIERRSTIGLAGSPILDLESDLCKALCWSDGHLLALYPMSDMLLLYASFYGVHSQMVAVSDEPQHWQDCVPRDGLVFIVCPDVRRCVGPKPLASFIAHRFGITVDAELAAVESVSPPRADWPPFLVDSGPSEEG